MLNFSTEAVGFWFFHPNKEHQKRRYDKYGENRQPPNNTLRALCNLPQKRCATSRMICLSSSPKLSIVSGSILSI